MSDGGLFKRCGCRVQIGTTTDPETGKEKKLYKQVGATCPKFERSGHGSWWFSLELPRRMDGLRPPPLRKGGFRTKQEAADALALARDRLRKGVTVGNKGTVADWLRYWLTEKTSSEGVSATGQQIRPTTERSYRQHIEGHLIPQIGHLPLEQLRAEHISAAYRAIRTGSEGRMGPATLQRVHATLRSSLNEAVKAGRLESNPATRVTLTAGTRPKVQPWEPAELGAFLDHVQGHPLGCLFEVMAGTGLRRGEALGLKWSDIDLEHGVITVRRQLVQIGTRTELAPTKTASGDHRIVDMDSTTMGALLAHQFSQEGLRSWLADDYNVALDLVFARGDGNTLDPSAVTKAFRKAISAVRYADDADKPDAERRRLRPVRLHDLRHGQASLLLAADVSLAIVSKRLGHSSISITSDTYSHLIGGIGKRAAEAASAMVPRAARSHTVHTSPESGSDRRSVEDVPAGQEGGPRRFRTDDLRIKSQSNEGNL